MMTGLETSKTSVKSKKKKKKCTPPCACKTCKRTKQIMNYSFSEAAARTLALAEEDGRV